LKNLLPLPKQEGTVTQKLALPSKSQLRNKS
jgi:hypothetical protein